MRSPRPSRCGARRRPRALGALARGRGRPGPPTPQAAAKQPANPRARARAQQILDKESYTLEELLDEDDIIQECKSLNGRLIAL